MLLEKSKYKVGDIINLKLISGDEVVGELVHLDDYSYNLKKPCVVVTSPEGIGLIQAMFGLDPDLETLKYKEHHIVTTCSTHSKMREHYISITSATD